MNFTCGQKPTVTPLCYFFVINKLVGKQLCELVAHHWVNCGSLPTIVDNGLPVYHKWQYSHPKLTVARLGVSLLDYEWATGGKTATY